MNRIFELESRLSKIHQLDRADDVKQKELITGLKVENVDLLNRIQSLESELVRWFVKKVAHPIPNTPIWVTFSGWQKWQDYSPSSSARI